MGRTLVMFLSDTPHLKLVYNFCRKSVRAHAVHACDDQESGESRKGSYIRSGLSWLLFLSSMLLEQFDYFGVAFINSEIQRRPVMFALRIYVGTLCNQQFDHISVVLMDR